LKSEDDSSSENEFLKSEYDSSSENEFWRWRNF
jgi:hypothetical protein